jgi:Ca-activated chloride channel family protein
MANTKTAKTGALIGIGAAVAALVIGGIVITSTLKKPTYQISEEEARAKLTKLLHNVDVKTVEPRKAPVDFTASDLANTLPDIDQYPLTVTGDGQVNIEIFASPEKAGSGTDGWLNEAAKSFNQQRNRTASGLTMSVSVRSISSGMGSDYIVSGKYLPDAFTPSNSMWGTMAVSNGAELSTKNGTDRLVGNVAGILLSDNMVQTLTADYGSITIETVTQAAQDGRVAMGYTYAYTSTTALNFLVSSLYSFDSASMRDLTAPF